MGYPELLDSTIDRPAGRSRAAPHQHGPAAEDGSTSGPERTLVELAIALQAGCQRCVEHHASIAGDHDVPRQRLVEALGTALLLSTPRADRWPRLAEAALSAHEQARS